MRLALVALLVAVPVSSSGQQIERWTLRQELRIGSLDDSEQALTTVTDIAIGPDQRMYIAQPTDHAIRVFDSTGRFVRMIGREGKGPGEFQRLGRVGFIGDTLYAVDQSLRRVSLFTGDGVAIEDFAMATPLSAGASVTLLPTPPTILLPGRRALVWPGMSARALSQGMDRIPMFFLRVDGGVDTVAVAEYESQAAVLTVKGRRIGVAKPFPDYPLFDFLADGSGVVVVRRRSATSRGEGSFEVVKMALNGDTVFRRAIAYEPQSTPRSRLAEWAEDTRVRLARRNLLVSTPDLESMAREEGRVPAFLPPVTLVTSASDGTIWIEREKTSAPKTTWQVIGPTGDLMATVELGRNETLKAASKTRLYTLELDSLDVPYVIRYRIARQPGM